MRSAPTRTLLAKTAVLAAALLCLSGSAHALSRPVPSECASMSVLGAGEIPLPVHRFRGTDWVEGENGSAYSVELTNRCEGRILAVVSVDGINVLDGTDARSDSGPGYVLEPGSSATVRGWRKSLGDVAAFRFSAPGQSYGAKTGRPANLGVIAAAFTAEKPLPPPAFSGEILSRKRSAESNRLEEADARGAAPSAKSSAPAPLAAPSLGTAHGERINDRVRRVEFERAGRPFASASFRYESRRALERMGAIPKRPVRPSGPNPFPGDGGFVPDP